MLRIHSFNYHQRYMKFFSQYFSFPCQYHSTNAPYSFIYIPPTLYDVFFPLLRFSRVSIIPPMLHTHSLIYYRRYVTFFFQYFRLPPVSIIPPMLYTHSFICHRRCVMFFSQYFRFTLSVSFHQCSILIHSSHTDDIWCFSPSTSVSPVSIIPPILHTYSFIYHRRYMRFFSQYFSFHCQYLSTNAPYSFIHLPPTLYEVFLPVLQFPLSVSFHQCSILIHSSTIDAVWCFSSSTSGFPCQYHSANAPYPFSHLPSTLYNFFLSVLQFSLSVSFCQCSIPIHKNSTDAIWCFSPSTSVSPVSIITPMLHNHSFTYQRSYIMFLSQYSVFPCQYHSANARYPFSHLTPMLNNVFLLVLHFSPVSIIPPWLHTHSFIYHRRYMTFFSQYFSFPCQYHSANAPHTFIQLPQMLYDVFLSVLQFPLSVSFHQCSILIH